MRRVIGRITRICVASDVELTGLSPSSLDLWRQCPRKFREEKIAGRSGGTGEAALMGTLVHLALERLMQREPGERSIAEARDEARQAWAEFSASDEWQGWVAATGFADELGFRRRAWASICGYYEIEDPARVEVLATERFISTHLEGVPVRGIVDRLERDVFGDIVVSDYKTGKVPAPWFRESKHRQLNLYAAMIEQVDGERPSEGRLLFTTYGEALGVDITSETVYGAVEAVSEAWQGVGEAQASGLWEAKPGPLCGWCPFVGECDAGLAEVRERRAAGKLKRSAPAWELAAGDGEET